MNDQDFKNLFKSMQHGEPSTIQIEHWKNVVQAIVRNRSRGEWTRLVAACLIGVIIGATAFRGHEQEAKNLNEDATIEQVHINLQ